MNPREVIEQIKLSGFDADMYLKVLILCELNEINRTLMNLEVRTF
jgi:hypothetical protein